MSTPPSYTQTASSMIPQYVNYGDTVFIGFPDISPKLIIGMAGNGTHLAAQQITTTSSITIAEPFIIDPPSGPQIPPPNTPSPVINNSQIRIRRANSSTQTVWYNSDGDPGVEVITANPNDSRASWTISLYQSSATTRPLVYGDVFTLVNAQGSQPINYDPGWPISTGNLKIDSGLSITTPDAAFTFLYGPLSTAQLQCCTNNPIYAGFCGDYQGNTYSGSCDTILSNYCQSVLLSDPNCGCLLPSSYYSGNSMIGPPECIDSRCVDVTGAYLTSQQHTEQCDITNCNISQQQMTENNISQSVINQYCGQQNNSGGSSGTPSSPSAPPPGTPPASSPSITANPWFWGVIGFVVVFLIIIIIVVLLTQGKKTK